METITAIVLVLVCFIPVLWMAFKIRYARDLVLNELEKLGAHEIDITSMSMSGQAVFFQVEYKDALGNARKRSGLVTGVFIPGIVCWDDQ